MAETKDGAVDPITNTPTDRDALLFDFGVDSFKLGPKHTAYLDDLIRFLEEPGKGSMTVSIDGLASHTGSEKHNLILSENREQAVENYLRAHSKVFDPGRPHTINRDFKGFSGSPPGENPRFRAVRITVHRPGVVPPPIPVPPPTPTTHTVGDFEVHLIGWIPQPEVDNPLSLLPGAVTSLLPPGMADPFFGGDDFVTPGGTPGATVPPHTFRATQRFNFSIGAWGAPPTAGAPTTTPGVTTCLDKRRSAGGKVTFSLTATLVRSAAAVTFSKFNNWYEVTMSGVVLDPVPAAAVAALSSKVPGVSPLLRPILQEVMRKIATKATPALTWDATVRIQQGPTLSPLITAEYALFTGDEKSSTLLGASPALAPGTDLIHGKVHFSQWPSAVIYLKFSPGGAGPVIQPIFFASGATVGKPETLQIEIPKLCKVRQITW